jgi:porin
LYIFEIRESTQVSGLRQIRREPCGAVTSWLEALSPYSLTVLNSVSRSALVLSFSIGALIVGGSSYSRAEPLTVQAISNGSNLADTTAPVDPFAKYEPLRIKGTNVLLPPPAETVDGQAGGLRSALADQGIGYFSYSLNSFDNNMLGGNDRAQNHPQQYVGQKATYFSQDYFYLTYDLSRFGIPDGQIVAGVYGGVSSWDPAALNKFGLASLSYYQTLFDKKVELKFGYLENSLEFVGPFVAGSLAVNVFGSAGNIPFQGGVTIAPTPTPSVNVKWNITDAFYDKVGIQRSSNPDGSVVEGQSNPTSLNFTTPNSGVLAINELGYRRFATPESSSLWVRGGAAYNSSDYKNNVFVGTRSGDNNFFYLLGDAQVSQPTPVKGMAARGLYEGFTAEYAPPDLNTFSQYYEFRSYYIGPFASRPSDVISLIFTRSIFSNYLVNNAIIAGNLAHSDSNSATLSYSAQLTPGVNASLGISYVDHPTTVTYVPKTGSALNFLSSVIVFF